MGVDRMSPTLWRRLWENSDYRIRAAALRILSRPITSAEREDAANFLESLPAEKAWIELSHALLASNEFMIRL